MYLSAANKFVVAVVLHVFICRSVYVIVLSVCLCVCVFSLLLTLLWVLKWKFMMLSWSKIMLDLVSPSPVTSVTNLMVCC